MAMLHLGKRTLTLIKFSTVLIVAFTLLWAWYYTGRVKVYRKQLEIWERVSKESKEFDNIYLEDVAVALKEVTTIIQDLKVLRSYFSYSEAEIINKLTSIANQSSVKLVSLKIFDKSALRGKLSKKGKKAKRLVVGGEEIRMVDILAVLEGDFRNIGEYYASLSDVFGPAIRYVRVNFKLKAMPGSRSLSMAARFTGGEPIPIDDETIRCETMLRFYSLITE